MCALLAVCSAGLLPAKPQEPFDPNPQYNFNYEVQDAETGDYKAQTETRDGDNVQGQYWLYDADGYRRIVDYTADAVNGFNAVVRREPLQLAPATPVQQPTAAPLPKPVKLEAPKIQAPLKPATIINTYSQPATFIRTYAAPTVVHHAPAAHTVVHHAAPSHIVHHTTHTGHSAVYAHHAPTVVKTSLSSPHFSYVY